MMIRKTLLAVALVAMAATAQASTYSFGGPVAFGDASVIGSVLSGQFSFSDAEVAAGGSDGTFTLQSLTVSFLGTTYDLSGASNPYLQFEGGVLTGPNASFATLDGGTLALQSFFGASEFTYVLNGITSGGTLAISAVPEPAAWALSLAGLVAVGLASRRRRQAVAAST